MVMTISEKKGSVKLEVMEGFRGEKWKGNIVSYEKISDVPTYINAGGKRWTENQWQKRLWKL